MRSLDTDALCSFCDEMKMEGAGAWIRRTRQTGATLLSDDPPPEEVFDDVMRLRAWASMMHLPSQTHIARAAPAVGP